MNRKSPGARVAAVLAVLWVLTLGDRSWGASTFPLDREAIFCIYYQLSGDPMADQDIEDLCFVDGKPLYSLYKPAEMFLKTALRERREALFAKMKGYGKAPSFLWTIKNPFKWEGPDKVEKAPLIGEDGMPQPTPYIRSALCSNGRQAVLNAIHSFLTSNPGSAAESCPEIQIRLVPEGIDRQFERRIMAQSEVLLPLRRVLFRPVEVRVSPPATPGPGDRAPGRRVPDRRGTQGPGKGRGVSE
jgi:hypothetical protein